MGNVIRVNFGNRLVESRDGKPEGGAPRARKETGEIRRALRMRARELYDESVLGDEEGPTSDEIIRRAVKASGGRVLNLVLNKKDLEALALEFRASGDAADNHEQAVYWKNLAGKAYLEAGNKSEAISIFREVVDLCSTMNDAILGKDIYDSLKEDCLKIIDGLSERE